MDVSDTEQQEDKIEECILEFQKSFFKQFGIVPRVIYTLGSYKIPTLTLKEFEKVGNIVMHTYPELKYIPNIKYVSRKRNLVLIRQCIFTLASEQGYSLQKIGTYFNNKDHATVLHGKKTFNNLIATNNIEALSVLKKIQDAIKNKYGNDENVPVDLRSRSNS
jgi:uncharacterized protein YjbK